MKKILSMILLISITVLASYLITKTSALSHDQPTITTKSTPSYEMISDELLAPYFYIITGNNIDPKNPVYLLGTNHTLSASDYSDAIRSKIENTDILISEFSEESTERTSLDYLNAFKLIHGKFMEQDLSWFDNKFTVLGWSSDKIKEGLDLIKEKKTNLLDPNFFETWFDQLTETEKKIIEEMNTETDVDLLSVHPAQLASFIYLLGNALLEKNNEKEPIENSFEVHLIKLFKKKNKEVVFLDNMETFLWMHLDYFLEDFQDDIDAHIKAIKYNIEVLGSSEEKDTFTWEASRYFDALDINGLISEDIDICTNARNLLWREKVLNALRSGKSASIITGAYHLKGESGFLNLFKSQGYHIQHVLVDEDTQKDVQRVMDFKRWIENSRPNPEPEENSTPDEEHCNEEAAVA